MSTIAEIKAHQTQSDFTPQERIDRILARLDSGEELNGGRLRRLHQFCILGLFADESGLGKWEPDGVGVFFYYMVDGDKLTADLNDPIVDLYNLVDQTARFTIANVPMKIKSFLTNEIYSYQRTIRTTSLMDVNDRMIDNGYSSKDINETLSTIIRSGAIFKEQKQNDTER